MVSSRGSRIGETMAGQRGRRERKGFRNLCRRTLRPAQRRRHQEGGSCHFCEEPVSDGRAHIWRSKRSEELVVEVLVMKKGVVGGGGSGDLDSGARGTNRYPKQC